MRQIPARLHESIIWCVDHAPIGNLLLLRIYNVILRTLGGPYRCRTYFGAAMICEPKDLIQHLILHFGVWEPNISRAIEQSLMPGDVCADIGANVGYETLLAAHLVGPQGGVVAIEASPSTYSLLRRNLDENGYSNVRPVQVAVSDSAGTVNLYGGTDVNRGRTTTLPTRELPLECTVQALPLDQILTSDERLRLRLIKMDIEGAEVAVVRRLLTTLDLYPESMRLLVEVSPCDEWRELFDQLVDVGFRAYYLHNSYDRRWYISSRNQRVPAHEIFEMPATQADILFSRTSFDADE